jgi:hypothetical protein
LNWLIDAYVNDCQVVIENDTDASNDDNRMADQSRDTVAYARATVRVEKILYCINSIEIEYSRQMNARSDANTTDDYR